MLYVAIALAAVNVLAVVVIARVLVGVCETRASVQCWRSVEYTAHTSGA